VRIVNLLLIISCFSLAVPIAASETVINKAMANKNGNGTFSFSVTLSHADKSWDHYANLWQVETMQGKVIARRVLHHPHINEQPFTRTLTNVEIPTGTKQVVIKAGCTIDGLNSKPVVVELGS